MNLKKAKRLRALVRHLQEKGAIVNKDWTIYSEAPNSQDGSSGNFHGARRCNKLDPTCGRAVYKQMKKRKSS